MSTTTASPIDGDIKLAEGVASTIATALGQPEIAVGIGAAGAVATSVADSVANHGSAVADASTAVTTALQTAPAVLKDLPADVQTKAAFGLAQASNFLSWWDSLLVDLEKEI